MLPKQLFTLQKSLLPVNDYGDTNFVTGMRAWAALAVVMIHAGGAGLREFGSIGNNIANFGTAGVYVFFVISGFSVTASYVATNNYAAYLNKRLWRIAPLYYFWIVIALFSMNSVDIYNVLMHVFFISFLDYKITNSILGVEWSISIEVFWYFVVPLMISFMKTKMHMLIACTSSLGIYLIASKFAAHISVNSFEAFRVLHWSPIPYVFSYCLGIAAFNLRSLFIKHQRSGDYILVGIVILLGFFLSGNSLMRRLINDEFILISVLVFVMLLVGSNKSKYFKLFFANRLILFLGTVSYGIYLSHLFVISMLKNLQLTMFSNLTISFLIVVIATVAVSTLTYFLIEKPSLKLGSLLAKRLNDKTSAAAN